MKVGAKAEVEENYGWINCDSPVAVNKTISKETKVV